MITWLGRFHSEMDHVALDGQNNQDGIPDANFITNGQDHVLSLIATRIKGAVHSASCSLYYAMVVPRAGRAGTLHFFVVLRAWQGRG